MANFDTILENLHTNSQVTDTDSSVITITPQRTFDVPADFNTTLGYAGDVNSQVVTFILPKSHEGHDLSLCNKHRLKWKNLANGVEGNNDLTTIKNDTIDKDTSWAATWEVPPEAMTQAGTLEIAISIFDIKDNIVAFSWNTASYKGFTIGESFVHVEDIWSSGVMPAKNEILHVDIEGRQIVAPAGYNKTICNYGDIGTSKVFFLVNRYVRGIDLMNENTDSSGEPIVKVYINIAYQTTTSDWIEIPKGAMAQYSQNSNKIILCWNVPSAITNNNQKYTGNISISLKFEETNVVQQIVKRWVSSSFTQLTIGPSLLTDTINDIVERDEEMLEKAIDLYFDKNYFTIGDSSIGE